MSKKNKKLDRAYFEKKKNPKYDDQESHTKCCNQIKDGNHMMKGNKNDWKLIEEHVEEHLRMYSNCLLYTSPSPRDTERSRMPSSA